MLRHTHLKRSIFFFFFFFEETFHPECHVRLIQDLSRFTFLWWWIVSVESVQIFHQNVLLEIFEFDRSEIRTECYLGAWFEKLARVFEVVKDGCGTFAGEIACLNRSARRDRCYRSLHFYSAPLSIVRYMPGRFTRVYR